MKKLIIPFALSLTLNVFATEPETRATNTDWETAMQAFKELPTKKTRKSQCFNRAYVWAHEMYTKHDIVSKKILIYYTPNKFKKEIDPVWTFHIAPVVLVEGENIVFDREFQKTKPANIDDWVTSLMKIPNRKLEKLRKELLKEKREINADIKILENKKKLLSYNESYYNKLDRLNAKIRKEDLKIAEVNQRMDDLEVNDEDPAEITCGWVDNIQEYDAIKFGEIGDVRYCYLQLVDNIHYKHPALERADKLYTDWHIGDLWASRKQAFKNSKELWGSYKDLLREQSERLKAEEKAKEAAEKAEAKRIKEENKRKAAAAKAKSKRIKEENKRKADAAKAEAKKQADVEKELKKQAEAKKKAEEKEAERIRKERQRNLRRHG